MMKRFLSTSRALNNRHPPIRASSLSHPVHPVHPRQQQIEGEEFGKEFELNRKVAEGDRLAIRPWTPPHHRKVAARKRKELVRMREWQQKFRSISPHLSHLSPPQLSHADVAADEGVVEVDPRALVGQDAMAVYRQRVAEIRAKYAQEMKSTLAADIKKSTTAATSIQEASSASESAALGGEAEAEAAEAAAEEEALSVIEKFAYAQFKAEKFQRQVRADQDHKLESVARIHRQSAHFITAETLDERIEASLRRICPHASMTRWELDRLGGERLRMERDALLYEALSRPQHVRSQTTDDASHTESEQLEEQQR